MKFLGDWKWNAALAILALFTVLVICWPRPGTRHLDNPAAPATAEPDVAPVDMPPARQDPTPAEHEAMLRYTVQEGDTVAGIARLFVIAEEEIRWANQMPDGGDLSVGELIWIPVP